MFSGARGGDVAERVAALVAVRRRIRQLADADAVEHDDDGASEHLSSLSARLRLSDCEADANQRAT